MKNFKIYFFSKQFLKYTGKLSKYNSRYFNGLLILDEAAFIDKVEEIWTASQQTLATGGGAIILSTPNNALYDFTPSKYATKYYNVPDLHHILMRAGFKEIQFFGFHRVDQTSIRQKLLRPLKALANKINLIPGSMKGKEILKKIYFGDLLEMPDKLELTLMEYQRPEEISSKTINDQHKIIYCLIQVLVKLTFSLSHINQAQ